jgi:hypothetical protein
MHQVSKEGPVATVELQSANRNANRHFLLPQLGVDYSNPKVHYLFSAVRHWLLGLY